MTASIVDAYSHVGMPRFQTYDEHRRELAAHGVDRAVLSAFGSSPDFDELTSALEREPARVRVIGIPVGSDRTTLEREAARQLDAGFSGLRLTDRDVRERGYLLDRVAAAGGVSVIAGEVARSDDTSAILLDHLRENASARVVAVHFAGAADPGVLDRPPQSELFGHPRMHVVFSRQGAFAREVVEPWARALVERFGWSRLLWGSEAPVLYWRGETLADALAWVDRLGPSDEERAAFFGGNAERLFFEQPPERLSGRPADARYIPSVDPWTSADVIPALLFAHGLPVDQELAGRLVHAWLADPPERREGFAAFVERTLAAGLAERTP